MFGSWAKGSILPCTNGFLRILNTWVNRTSSWHRFKKGQTPPSSIDVKILHKFYFRHLDQYVTPNTTFNDDEVFDGLLSDPRRQQQMTHAKGIKENGILLNGWDTIWWGPHPHPRPQNIIWNWRPTLDTSDSKPKLRKGKVQFYNFD